MTLARIIHVGVPTTSSASPDTENLATLREAQRAVHRLATDQGLWGDAGGPGMSTERFLAAVSLIHAELSEAVEAARSRGICEVYYGSDGKPEGASVELADALILILSLLGEIGADAEDLLAVKHEYNRIRPPRR